MELPTPLILFHPLLQSSNDMFEFLDQIIFPMIMLRPVIAHLMRPRDRHRRMQSPDYTAHDREQRFGHSRML